MRDVVPAQILCGETRATIEPLGATLTGLWIRDQQVLAGPGRAQPALGHHGAVLTPWPNRIAAGRYVFDATEYQLPVNDPRFGHALHGLAFDKPWEITQHSAEAISLRCTVGGIAGYPFRVCVTVRYEATETGLRCEASWRNAGRESAPFGIGFHPYFRPGPSPLAEWIVSADAVGYLDTDPLTALPTAEGDVAGSPYDFRTPRALGPDRMSIALRLRSDGSNEPAALRGSEEPNLNRVASSAPAAVITVRDQAGLTLSITTSSEFGWIQLFSGDLPTADLNRRGLGIEPQTCPPNAFVSGEGLVVLKPGDVGSAHWAVDAVPSCSSIVLAGQTRSESEIDP